MRNVTVMSKAKNLSGRWQLLTCGSAEELRPPPLPRSKRLSGTCAEFGHVRLLDICGTEVAFVHMVIWYGRVLIGGRQVVQ